MKRFFHLWFDIVENAKKRRTSNKQKHPEGQMVLLFLRNRNNNPCNRIKLTHLLRFVHASRIAITRRERDYVDIDQMASGHCECVSSAANGNAKYVFQSRMFCV